MTFHELQEAYLDKAIRSRPKECTIINVVGDRYDTPLSASRLGCSCAERNIRCAVSCMCRAKPDKCGRIAEQTAISDDLDDDLTDSISFLL